MVMSQVTTDEVVEEKSRLQQLLEWNASPRGLTSEEKEEAWSLLCSISIQHSEDNKCWLCECAPALEGINLCRSHAIFAFVSGR